MSSRRRLVDRLLDRAIGSAWRETARGDLEEESAEIRQLRGPWAARAWFWRQTFALLTSAMRLGLVRSAMAVREGLRAGDHPMRVLVQETHLAIRALVRQPGLVFVVLLTLALGVGVNAATFSMFDALVLRPLSLRDSDRLTMLGELMPGDDERQESVSSGNFYDWRREAKSFDHLAAFEWWWVNLAGGSEPEHVMGFQVTGEFFDSVGVQPALGRLIGPTDEIWGQHRVVVLSDQLWRRRFGARPEIVGQTIRVDGEPYVVIGVTPPSFDFPMRADLWGAFGASPERVDNRRDRSLTGIGHLRPGVSLERAQAEMTLIGTRERERYPIVNRDRVIRVYTLAYGMMDTGLPNILALVQTGAIFVLLIAGLNISNLLLARSGDRHREFSVRVALGASRWRIARQLVIEGGVLGVASVPVALGCAWVATRLLRESMPARIERFVDGWQHLGVDGRVILVTVGVTVCAACLISLVPAIRATSVDPNAALKQGGRSATAGRARHRLQSTLVVGQIALVLPLLVASALATLGAARFSRGPQGYDPTNLLTFETSLPTTTYPDEDSQQAFVDRLLERLSHLPGVTSVGMVNVLPASDSDTERPVQVEGSTVTHPEDLPLVPLRIISTQYFDTLRIPVLRGRALTDRDRRGTLPVAVVTQAMAAKLWPGATPIGRRFRVVDNPKAPGPWLTIVGIAADTVDDWVDRRNAPMFYVPFRQMATVHPALALRTISGDPTAIAPDVLRALHDVDPDEPASDVMSMERLLRERTTGIVVVGAMMGVLGGLALVLGIVGLYSLLAYYVSRRQHEIGIRMALGADRARVLRLTLRQAGQLSVVGILIGLVFAILLARAMESALFGVVALEPGLIAAAVLTVAFATLLAAAVPARRATRTDPVAALREA